MQDPTEEIRAEVKGLLSLLVGGQLSEMHRRGLFGTSDLNVVQEVIKSYPGEMTLPPDSAFLNFPLYGDFKAGTLVVEFPLWFDGGESDLHAFMVQQENSISRSLYIYDLRVP